jgi:nucleoside-diphosphate-sugar epimerase
MNFLIIGSASEIAKYFLERFIQDGNSVKGLSVEPGDINWGYNIDFLTEKITAAKPDVIINFVGNKASIFSDGFEGNVLVSRNIMETAVKINYTGKIILIGSAAEYGYQNEYSETIIEKPVSIYGLTKLMQKEIFEYYYRIHKINCCYIRPFNILYEKIFDKNLFVGTFNRQMMEILSGNSHVLTLGNLDSYRDYILIDDLYSAVLKVVSNGSPGEVYNIGLGEALHIKKFVEKILILTDKNIQIATNNHVPLGNINSKVIADISKIRRIGWSPEFSPDLIPEIYYSKLLQTL